MKMTFYSPIIHRNPECAEAGVEEAAGILGLKLRSVMVKRYEIDHEDRSALVNLARKAAYRLEGTPVKGLRKRKVKFSDHCPHGSENCPCMYTEVVEEIEVTTTREHLSSAMIGIAELVNLNNRVGNNHIDKYLDPEEAETLDAIIQRLLKKAGGDGW